MAQEASDQKGEADKGKEALSTLQKRIQAAESKATDVEKKLRRGEELRKEKEATCEKLRAELDACHESITAYGASLQSLRHTGTMLRVGNVAMAMKVRRTVIGRFDIGAGIKYRPWLIVYIYVCVYDCP